MAGNASFGRLSTDSGVRAFLKLQGIEGGSMRMVAGRPDVQRGIAHAAGGGRRIPRIRPARQPIK